MSDAEGKAEELREEIEQTQEELSATVDAIEERLSPQHLKEQAQETAEQVVAQATEAVHEATIGKVNHMIRSVRVAVDRVTGGARERTTMVVTRAGERIQGYRAVRTGAAGTTGTAGQTEGPAGQIAPPPAAESGGRVSRLPGWGVGLAGGVVGGLLLGVVLGRALVKRAHADALASAALLTPASPQDIPPDVAARSGGMVWKRA